MEKLGYRLQRDENYEHPSWIAPGWKRAIRMESLGKGYSRDDIYERIDKQMDKGYLAVYCTPYKVRTPLKNLEHEMSKLERMSGIQLTFYIFTELLKICLGTNAETQKTRPLSPELRAEVRKMDQHIQEYWLLRNHNISTSEELTAFKDEVSEKISSLEEQRYKLRLKIRRAKSPEEDAELKEKCKAITKELSPLRYDLKTALRVEEASPRVQELVEAERQMEDAALKKERQRAWER